MKGGVSTPPLTVARDEVEASGGARSEALPLLHRCTGSSDGLTAPIHGGCRVTPLASAAVAVERGSAAQTGAWLLERLRSPAQAVIGALVCL